MLHSTLVILVTILAVAVLVTAYGHWLGPLGWMDHPTGRKNHPWPTPRVGGLALLTILIITQLLGVLTLGLTPLEWAAVLLMGGIGALDDRYNIRARWKAAVGMLVAIPLATAHTIYLLESGIQVTLFGMAVPNFGGFYFVVLIMWFWGVPHSYNLIDGVNGLSLGFSLLLLGALCLGPGSLIGLGTEPLWGALLGLLLFNYPKARHFMGDAGALALGTLFAILVMERALPTHRGLGFWLMAWPILDVTTVVLIRLYARRPLSSPDRSHIHHWLMDRLGGRAWLVAPVLLLFAALPMARDLDLSYGKYVAWVGTLVLACLAGAVFVDRAILHPEEIKKKEPKPTHPFLNDPSGTHPLR